jgi:hypothetical protein
VGIPAWNACRCSCLLMQPVTLQLLLAIHIIQQQQLCKSTHAQHASASMHNRNTLSCRCHLANKCDTTCHWLTNAVCDVADVSRQEAACALLVHLGTRCHTIDSNQHHTPPRTRSSSSSSSSGNNRAGLPTTVKVQSNCGCNGCIALLHETASTCCHQQLTLLRGLQGHTQRSKASISLPTNEPSNDSIAVSCKLLPSSGGLLNPMKA